MSAKGLPQRSYRRELLSSDFCRTVLYVDGRGAAGPGRNSSKGPQQRPAEAEDRAAPGHWEGDLVEGSRGSYIATLVERQSRFVIIVKVADKRTETVVAALIKAVRKLPAALRRSLTWDRGMELANHAQFTVATDLQVYFCDPSSPWQRGSNENTNGLLRQYYPKGMDLSAVSQARLDTVARKLNTRPRETLHWKTPAYVLGTSVSTIH